MRRRRCVRALALVAVLACFGVACGQPVSTGALTVPEALEAGGEAVVEGYVFSESQALLLCEAVAESFPPQCGGASLVVGGASAEDFRGLRSGGERSWSDTLRRVRGTVAGESITVTEVDL